MKFRTRAIGAVVAVLAVSKVYALDVSADTMTSTQEPSAVTQTAMDYLQVQDDGTVSMKVDAIGRIPEGQRQAAITSLADVNAQIREGKVPPFTADDARLKVAIGDNGAQMMGNCFCSAGCCSQHMCCSSGWWLLCWGYGSC